MGTFAHFTATDVTSATTEEPRRLFSRQGSRKIVSRTKPTATLPFSASTYTPPTLWSGGDERGSSPTRTKHTLAISTASYCCSSFSLIELLADAIQTAVCLPVSKQIPRRCVLCLYNSPPPAPRAFPSSEDARKQWRQRDNYSRADRVCAATPAAGTTVDFSLSSFSFGPPRRQVESAISLVTTLSGRRERGGGGTGCQNVTQAVSKLGLGGRSVCEPGEGGGPGGFGGADCPWCEPLLNEVIASALSICYRGSGGEQGVAMARWTQKGVAWEQVQGSGVRVGGGQGSQPAGQHTRGGRVRKREGKFVFSFLVRRVDAVGR